MTQELLIRLSRLGYKIAEAPIAHKEKENKFPIFKKIIWNLFALFKMYNILKDLKWSKKFILINFVERIY